MFFGQIPVKEPSAGGAQRQNTVKDTGGEVISRQNTLAGIGGDKHAGSPSEGGDQQKTQRFHGGQRGKKGQKILRDTGNEKEEKGQGLGAFLLAEGADALKSAHGLFVVKAFDQRMSQPGHGKIYGGRADQHAGKTEKRTGKSAEENTCGQLDGLAGQKSKRDLDRLEQYKGGRPPEPQTGDKPFHLMGGIAAEKNSLQIGQIFYKEKNDRQSRQQRDTAGQPADRFFQLVGLFHNRDLSRAWYITLILLYGFGKRKSSKIETFVFKAKNSV